MPTQATIAGFGASEKRRQKQKAAAPPPAPAAEVPVDFWKALEAYFKENYSKKEAPILLRKFREVSGLVCHTYFVVPFPVFFGMTGACKDCAYFL